MTRRHELEQEKAKYESQVEDICCDLAECNGRISETGRKLLLAERHRLNNRLQIIQGELDHIDGKPGIVDVSDRDAPYLLQCEGAE